MARIAFLVLGTLAALCLAVVGRGTLALAGRAGPAPPASSPVAAGSSAATTPAGAAHPRLLRAQRDVFVIDGRTRRWIVSPQVFADYRLREEWVEQVSGDEMEAIPRGADLVAGPVLRAPDGELWVVYQGTRRQVAGPDAWAPLYLAPSDALPATDAQVRSYAIGRPIGNPRRPWLLALVALALAGGAIICWLDRVERAGRALYAGIGLLAVAGAAGKLCYVTLYPWLPDGADAPAYLSAARYLASGGSIWRDDPQGALISVTSPGYPMILALFARPLALAHDDVVAWKVLQAGAATLLPFVVADLAQQLYGARAGRAALVVALLSPLWLFSAELLQYELWYALLAATGAWALICLAAAQRARWRWVTLAGACYGLLMVVQLKSLALLLPAVAFLAWYVAARRGGRRRGVAPMVALFGALSLAPLAAWGARNVALHGEPLLGSTGGGAMLWMGNHDGADGGYVQVPRPATFYDRQQRYPQTSITRDARAFADLALQYIAQHPSSVALLGLTKLERFWWTISPDRLGEFAEGRTVAFLGGAVDGPALRLAAKLLDYGSVALAGAALLWGRRLAAPAPARAGRWLVFASIAAFWLIHAPFIVEPRYRIPIAPLLQALEGAGIVLLLDALRFRHGERDG